MKKINLKILASAALLTLTLGANHPALSSNSLSSSPPKIDMANLLAQQRIEVAQLRQQGKSDTEILDIITAPPPAIAAPPPPPPLSRMSSKIEMSKLTPSERSEVSNLRKEGKTDKQIITSLTKTKPNRAP